MGYMNPRSINCRRRHRRQKELERKEEQEEIEREEYLRSIYQTMHTTRMGERMYPFTDGKKLFYDEEAELEYISESDESAVNSEGEKLDPFYIGSPDIHGLTVIWTDEKGNVYKDKKGKHP